RVHLDERGTPGQPRVHVGHAHGHAFVQREHELDLGVLLQDVHEALLGGAGVAEDVSHPVRDQLLDHRALAGHLGHGSIAPLTGCDAMRTLTSASGPTPRFCGPARIAVSPFHILSREWVGSTISPARLAWWEPQPEGGGAKLKAAAENT